MKHLISLTICLIAYSYSYCVTTYTDSLTNAELRRAVDKLRQGEACKAALYACDSLVRVDSAAIAVMQRNNHLCDSISEVVSTQRNNYLCALQQSELNVADMRTILAKQKQIARRRFWRGVGISSGIAIILGGVGGAIGAYYILH